MITPRYGRWLMLGELIAVGRTSEVYAFGANRAAKVLNADVPAHWADAEATFTAAVRQLGVRAPEVHDVTTVDGRPAIVFERITGRSMWDAMMATPSDHDVLTDEFVEVQRSIHRAGIPAGLPSSRSRMCGKIQTVAALSASDRAEACHTVEALPSGAALLHGDLHPGNVLMSADGPVAIDWFDATIGHPVTDVVRTALLLRPMETDDQHHLPGADRAMLHALHDRYVAAIADVLLPEIDRLADWETVGATSRLAEGADPDPAGLADRCASRDSSATMSLLARALRSTSG